jgi:quinol monooxygenase YgiN
LAIFSIWESYFPPELHDAGREVTEAIWKDMESYEGYVSHQLIQDLDDAGHLMVLSTWSSREAADAVLEAYAGNPNAERANAMVSRPRTRFLGDRIA